MTTSYDSRTPTPVQQVLVCYHKERIIGHIVEQEGQYRAQSWPAEVLIGIYENREEAEAAIAYAADLHALGKADGGVTVHSYQEPSGSDELFDEMWEIIEDHRIRQFCALQRFLEERGFQHKDVLPLILHAEQRYADDL